MFTAARALAFFSGLMSVGLAFSADFIVALILGPEWNYSATIFRFLALSLFASFVWEHARFVFISRGRTDTMRRYAVGAAIVHVAAFSVGVVWGAVGVAIALAVASLIVTAPLLIVSARVADCRPADLAAQFAPSFAAMLVTGAAIYLVAQPPIGGDWWAALGSSAVIALVYLGCHAALLPFSRGWRSDMTRLWAAGHAVLARMRQSR